MVYVFATAILLHALWVLLDARRRGNDPLGWAVGAACLWAFVVPFYLAKRNLKAGETREGGVAWNVLRVLALLWTMAMLAVAVSYVSSVGKIASTAGTDVEKAGFAIGGTIGIALLFATWFLPTLAAVVVGLLVRKSSLVETGPTGPLVGLAPGIAPPASTARAVFAAAAILVLFALLGVQASSAPTPPTPRVAAPSTAPQLPAVPLTAGLPKSSVEHPPEKPASPPSARVVSIAVYRGETLTECADMERAASAPSWDAGVPGCHARDGKPCSPEYAATGLFVSFVEVSYNNLGKEKAFHWTKLDKACAEEFRNRSPLATCQLEWPPPVGLTEKRSFYLVEQVFDREAPKRWCGNGAGWKMVSRESEEYRRESLIQATPKSPAFLPDGQGVVRFGNPNVRAMGFGATKVMVQVQNITATALSCSLTATFMDGDAILGTAQGTVNQIPANATKTAELLSADKIRGYSVLKLQTDTCF